MGGWIPWLGMIVMALMLLLQQQNTSSTYYNSLSNSILTMATTTTATATESITPTTKIGSNIKNNNNIHNPDPVSLLLTNPLLIPPGQAPNLPSLRGVNVQDNINVDDRRKIYGGKGDAKHLGGFTELDLAGVSPAVWKYMVSSIGVHSLLDVGCGRGISSTWFAVHGVDTLCVEGSHDAAEQSILAKAVDPQRVVEHDFARGPWWPEQTYDAAWVVEVLEHIGVQYHFNYITALRKCAILFVTSSRWGGWHHVEVHSDAWWIRKYESYGFRYDSDLTATIRSIAKTEANTPPSSNNNSTEIAPNGERYNAQHIWLSMKVFINPMVASLPKHAHLFHEPGCYGGRKENTKSEDSIIHRKCGTGREGSLETPLPDHFYPLNITRDQDTRWAQIIRNHLTTIKLEKQ